MTKQQLQAQLQQADQLVNSALTAIGQGQYKTAKELSKQADDLANQVKWNTL